MGIVNFLDGAADVASHFGEAISNIPTLLNRMGDVPRSWFTDTGRDGKKQTTSEATMLACDSILETGDHTARGLASIIGNVTPANWAYGSRWAQTVLYELPRKYSNRLWNPGSEDTYVTPVKEIAQDALNNSLPGFVYTTVTGRRPTDEVIVDKLARMVGMQGVLKTVTISQDQLNAKFEAALQARFKGGVTPEQYEQVLAHVVRDLRREHGDSTVIAIKAQLPDMNGHKQEYFILLEGDPGYHGPSGGRRDEKVVKYFGIRKTIKVSELEKQIVESTPEAKSNRALFQEKYTEFLSQQPGLCVVDDERGIILHGPKLGQTMIDRLLASEVDEKLRADAKRMSEIFADPKAKKDEKKADKPAPVAAPQTEEGPLAFLSHPACKFGLMGLGGVVAACGLFTGGLATVIGIAMVGAGFLIPAQETQAANPAPVPEKSVAGTGRPPANSGASLGTLRAPVHSFGTQRASLAAGKE